MNICNNRRLILRLLTTCTITCCLVTFCLLWQPVSAQTNHAPAPTLYDIELIVFQPLNPTTAEVSTDATLEDSNSEPTIIADETTPDLLPEPLDAMTTVADNPTQQPIVIALPASQFRLTNIAANLKRSRNYRLLSQVAWTQAATRLRSKDMTPLNPLLSTTPNLTGTAQLTRGTTLHLTLDISLQDEAARYHINETRQIKIGEKHYFDHPHFGVIALLSPHKEAPNDSAP